MKAAVTFEAETRDQSGKGAARALRREKKVPAILYGQGKEPIKLALPLKELTLAFHKGAFSSKVVELKVGKESFHALPREVQLHPVTDVIEHADFQRVDGNSKIKVFVPVKFHNLEKSVGLKRGGVLNIVRHELELVCTPDSIPTVIDIDILERNIGDSIHISHVALPKGVTPAITGRDFTIATIAGRSAKQDAADEAPAAGAAAAAAPAAGAAAAPAKDAKGDKK